MFANSLRVSTKQFALYKNREYSDEAVINEMCVITIAYTHINNVQSTILRGFYNL
jgi:biotin synthase-related radical SAM superfamily protein